MNKRCAFTIVAKNYIGLAELLGMSLKKVNPEIDFKIVVADKFEEIPNDLSENVYMAADILPWSEEQYVSYAFKYNITEFCTALKPGSILYFFDQGYEEVIYFDPDIFIFSSIAPIFDLLNRYQIVLTPHIAKIHTEYNGDHPEWMINCDGIFNLGFGAFRKSDKTIKFLEWWNKRLEKECFSDRVVGDFTDQKWMDWVPAFFNSNEFYTSQHLGMNLAPWNFFEREVIEKDGKFMVRERNEKNDELEELMFVHFSGFKYKLLKDGIIGHSRNSDLDKYADLLPIYSHYGNFIKENASIFDKYIDQPYTYGFFENGLRIDLFHRRLYNGLVKEGKAYSHPFKVGPDTYYDKLKRAKLIQVNNTSGFTRSSVKDIDSKKKILNKFYRVLFRLVGYARYVLLTKSHIDYCRPEAHTFLIKEK